MKYIPANSNGFNNPEPPRWIVKLYRWSWDRGTMAQGLTPLFMNEISRQYECDNYQVLHNRLDYL